MLYCDPQSGASLSSLASDGGLRMTKGGCLQVESTFMMQKIQPKVKEIQNKYKGNQEKAQLEVARLYREAEVLLSRTALPPTLMPSPHPSSCEGEVIHLTVRLAPWLSTAFLQCKHTLVADRYVLVCHTPLLSHEIRKTVTSMA